MDLPEKKTKHHKQQTPPTKTIQLQLLTVHHLFVKISVKNKFLKMWFRIYTWLFLGLFADCN